MARLPDPIVGEMPIAWPEDYKKKNILLNNMVAQAIRKKRLEIEKKEIKEKDDKKK